MGGGESIARFSRLNAGLHTPILWATAHPHGSVQVYKHLRFVRKAKFLTTLHGSPWLSAKTVLLSLAFNTTGQQEAYRVNWKKKLGPSDYECAMSSYHYDPLQWASHLPKESAGAAGTACQRNAKHPATQQQYPVTQMSCWSCKVTHTEHTLR